MNYEAKDLPYNQFEKIGMSKREVLAMPSEDLKALLTGRTTSLQTIRMKDQGQERSMQVKLSVQRFQDGSLNLMVHPIRREIRNEDNLSDTQLEQMKKGDSIIAPKTSLNGEKELYLFQLDRETNEIVKARLNSISVPRYLMDIELSPKNKSDLLQGKVTELEDNFGRQHTVAVDLISPKGYRIHNPEQKMETARGIGKDEAKIPTGIKR